MDVISVINLVNAQDCLESRSFRNNWYNQNYKEQIINCLGDEPLKSDVVGLGSKLSEIFSASSTGRDQSNVSSAGNAWLRLVCWYLNLCLIGTRSFATLSSALIPKVARDSLELKFNGTRVSGSNEIVLIEYAGDQTPTVNMPINTRLNFGSVYSRAISSFLNAVPLDNIRIILLAAKTNCSDMVSIPLFWSFCYKGNKQEIFNIQVGSSDKTPEMTLDGTVKYAVVTVPTGQQSRIEAGQIPGPSTLKKLSLLDGGFYWGRSTTTRVRSIARFYEDNLPLSAKYAGEAVASAYQGILSGKSALAVLFDI